MRVTCCSHGKPQVLAVAACMGFSGILMAQGRGGGPPAPPPINMSKDPMLQAFQFRSIGPAVMGGRVDDIVGSEQDPMTMYIGFATGGLWKSTDGGIHWKSMFDEMAERVDRLDRHRAFRPERGLRRAPAKATTGRVRRSATACGAPPTAASTGITSASKRRSRSSAWWWIRRIPRSSSWRLWATCSVPIQNAACTSTTGRRQDLEDGQVHRRRHRLHRCRHRSFQSQDPLRSLVPAPAHLVGI